jgi:hypothetical protein
VNGVELLMLVAIAVLFPAWVILREQRMRREMVAREIVSCDECARAFHVRKLLTNRADGHGIYLCPDCWDRMGMPEVCMSVVDLRERRIR